MTVAVSRKGNRVGDQQTGVGETLHCVLFVPFVFVSVFSCCLLI